MPSFLIESRRIKNLPDVQRTWLWELVIANITGLIDIGATDLEDDLIIRARSVQLPGRAFDIITSNFAGMSQLFPGKPTFERTLPVVFEETEEQLISKFLYAWNQAIFDVDPNSPKAGVGSQPTKRMLTKTIYLNMYKFDGSLMEKRIKFWNCFPSNVASVDLNYEASESVKINVTFSFDFWTMESI